MTEMGRLALDGEDCIEDLPIRRAVISYLFVFRVFDFPKKKKKKKC